MLSHLSSPPIIAERTLQQWMDDKGAGNFTKAVRATIDPKWGKDPSDTIVYEIEVECSRSTSEVFTYRIEADNVEDAREQAYDQAREEGRWDDVSVLKVKEICK